MSLICQLNSGIKYNPTNRLIVTRTSGQILNTNKMFNDNKIFYLSEGSDRGGKCQISGEKY